MSAASLVDEHAERVAALVRDAFVGALGERLECLAVHGSAVTGYLPGMSDFDFVLFMRGRLSLDDARALQAALGGVEIAPFTYLQLSRVVDLDDPDERQVGLIDGAHALLHGAIPEGWAFHDAEELRERGREQLAALQQRWHSRNEDWSVEGGPRRTNRLRLFMTNVKPCTRALLVELGEPVIEVWTAAYPELAHRLRAHEPALAKHLDAVLASMPAGPDDEPHVGAEVLRLLDGIGRRAREMGIE
jgi:hypothetical protein